jgi:MFS family permease
MDNTQNNRRQGLTNIIRALQYRNYRLYFVGQGISLIGTWMQSAAMSWLVYRLTGSSLLLGTVGFASQIPSFLLSPIGGIIADRLNRRRILIITQSLAMIQALTLSALVLTQNIRVWQIIVLSILSGLIFAFDAPTRQSFIVDMTEDRSVLSNAIALNSSIFNSARIVGPAVAGVIIAAIGEGLCFLLNGISYIAVIASLVAMVITQQQNTQRNEPVWSGIAEGFKYTIGFQPIRYVLLLLAFISLMGMPYTVLMPIFAGTILHGNSRTYGFLVAASGFGALIGALYLASRKSVLGLGRWIVIAAILFGAGLIIFALSRTTWLSAAILAVTGFGMIVQMASSNTIIQTIVEEDKRGRVMSFYTMAFIGTAPFGSLIAGAMGNKIGAPNTVILGGAFCIISAILFAIKLPSLRQLIRPIYERLEIIPAVSSGGLQCQVEVTGEPED